MFNSSGSIRTIAILTIGVLGTLLTFLYFPTIQPYLPYLDRINVPKSTEKISIYIQSENRLDENFCFAFVIRQIKFCLFQKLAASPQSHNWIYRTVTICSAILTKNLNLTVLPNQDETKYVTLPDKYPNVTECTVVTLGVGNDVWAESKLKSVWPVCKFFGADPIKESGQVYATVGKYYQMAVGAKNGIFDASVFENGTYHSKRVEYVNFEKFLNLIKIDFVDYLFLDAEGAEFEILPILLNTTKPDSKITICSFNAEFHLPLESHGMNPSKFNNLMKDFISESTFIPIKATGGHIRMTWINYGNPKCTEKYFTRLYETICQKYLN